MSQSAALFLWWTLTVKKYLLFLFEILILGKSQEELIVMNYLDSQIHFPSTLPASLLLLENFQSSAFCWTISLRKKTNFCCRILTDQNSRTVNSYRSRFSNSNFTQTRSLKSSIKVSNSNSLLEKAYSVEKAWILILVSES